MEGNLCHHRTCHMKLYRNKFKSCRRSYYQPTCKVSQVLSIPTHQLFSCKHNAARHLAESSVRLAAAPHHCNSPGQQVLCKDLWNQLCSLAQLGQLGARIPLGMPTTHILATLASSAPAPGSCQRSPQLGGPFVSGQP